MSTLMSDELKRTLGILPSSDSVETVVDSIDGIEGILPEQGEPAKFELTEVATLVPDLELTDAKVDYVAARNHTYTLLKMTTDALAKSLKVASETEHPRAFESFNSLATTARNLTLDLLALQKTMKEIVKDRQEITPKIVQQETQEKKVGSTNILDMLKTAIANGEITPMGDIIDGEPE